MNFPSERILRIAIAVIAAIGIGVATYIFIADSTAGAPTCLVGGGGCETVAKSSYSHIAGINIAIFGIIGWVLILAKSVFMIWAVQKFHLTFNAAWVIAPTVIFALLCTAVYFWRD